MTPEQFERLSALLDEALELSAPERDDWLAELATRDPNAAAHVRELLASLSAAEADRLLETRDVIEQRLVAAQQPASPEGRRFGPYHVLRHLGDGGMGTVWLAERADGLFSRRVALKLLHHGVAGSTITERFARERQILASLDHPNIARLLDAGFGADGQPYLALEYVEGTPLNAYCDANRLSVRARLDLFFQVTTAVQFAHANLVIHRDLKPSNILVTAEGQVRLLDFGVAKLLTEGEAQPSELTRLDGSGFTPEYASPEQVTNATVTTASDVYSLGVVLYELLCGRRPYVLKRTTRGALEDAIIAADPPKPSQVPLSATDAENRSTTVRRLGQTLAGDLDTIVLKALRKMPAERYETVDAFAQDLRRHLAGEPVRARPDRFAYRLGKFVARNRWPVAGAALVAAALAASSVVSLWQAHVAREQAALAQREATRAQVVQDFLLDIFRTNSVQQADPLKAQATTARELLDIGAKRVTEGLKHSPEAQQDVLDTLANMYYQLGLTDEARRQHRQRVELIRGAFGPDDPRLPEALMSYVEAILDGENRDQALPLLAEAGRILDAQGDFASETRGRLLMMTAHAHRYTSFDAMRRHADESVAFFKRHHAHTMKVPLALQAAGRARLLLGEYEAAMAIFREALAEVAKHEPGRSAFAVIPLIGLAQAHAVRLEIPDAERYYREALATVRERYGEHHGERLQTEAKLGAFLHATSRRDEGRRLLESAVQKATSHGNNVPSYVVAVVSGIYGVTLLNEGRLIDAERFIGIDVDDARRNYPGTQPLATALRSQAALFTAQGRLQDAQAALDEAFAVWQRIAAAGADAALSNAYWLERARLRIARGDPEAALKAVSQIAAPRESTRGRSLLDEIQGRTIVADAHLAAGRIAEAFAIAQQAQAMIEESPLRAYYQTIEADAALRVGLASMRMRDAKQARAHLERAVELREANDDPQSPWLAQARLGLADCVAEFGDRARAASLREKAHAALARHTSVGKQFAAVGTAPRPKP